MFGALADSTRRIIIDELADRNGQTLFEICSRLAMRHGIGLSRQAVTKHLGVLERARIVRVERAGRCRLHYLETESLLAARAWVARYGGSQKQEER